MIHDLALESPLADLLSAAVAPGSPWDATLPLGGPVTAVRPVDELGLPADRMSLATPLALWYGLGDEVVLGGTGEGSAQRWAQDWWVIVAARHVGRPGAVSLVRDLAGPLRTRVRLALSGWTPDRRVWSPLERVAPGSPPVYLVGYAEFPMRFRTRVSYQSVPARNRASIS